MIDARLRTLRVLRSQQTITATAASLHLTPSTVSQQLKQLAGELGVALLEPDGRRVRLTPAAELLLEHAEGLFEQWEQLRGDLAAWQDGRLGRLRIVGMPSVVAGLVVPAATTLRADHPGLGVTMSTHESPDCYRLLLAGEADIAVVAGAFGTPSVDDDRFSHQWIHDDIEDLLVPTDHPFATRKTAVTLAEAADCDWVGLDQCLDQQHLTISAAAQAGFTPRFRHHAGDWMSGAAMVAAGFGIGMLPRLARLPSEYAVVRVPLAGDVIPVRRFNVVVRAGSRDQPAIVHGTAALESAAATLENAAGVTRNGQATAVTRPFVLHA